MLVHISFVVIFQNKYGWAIQLIVIFLSLVPEISNDSSNISTALNFLKLHSVLDKTGGWFWGCWLTVQDWGNAHGWFQKWVYIFLLAIFNHFYHLFFFISYFFRVAFFQCMTISFTFHVFSVFYFFNFLVLHLCFTFFVFHI